MSIDAMGCQKDIAAKIVSKKADYMLAVKENQRTLLAEVTATFAAAAERDDHDNIVDFAETKDTGHGRTETRRCLTCWDLSPISRHEEWPKLATVVMVEVERTLRDRTSVERRYFISSKKRLTAKTALSTVRAHWGIENGHIGFSTSLSAKMNAGCAREMPPRTSPCFVTSQ